MGTLRKINSPVVWAIAFAALWTAAYHAATLFNVAPHASAWYPASGVGFAFIFLFGWRFWPVYLLAVLANVNPDPEPLTFTAAQALRQTITYGGGALLLRHFFGDALTPSFRQALAFVFVGLGASLTSGVLASLIYLSHGLIGRRDAADIMLGFWVGDATGLLVTAPLCALLVQSIRLRSRAQPAGWEVPRWGDVSWHTLLIVACMSALFWITGEVGRSSALEILILLPIILIAMAGGHRAVVLILPVANAVPALCVQIFGLHTTVLDLQIMLLANAVLGLLLGAVVSERRSLVARLLDHQATLEQTVREKTQHLEEEIAARERAQQEKARFLATVSHDCRQPLQALALMLATLEARYNGADNLAFLSRIQASVHSLTEFFKELMDLARMESGAMVVRPQAVDIGGMLERLRPDFELLATDKGLTLRVVDCSAVVTADPVLLERALRNLAGNAIRYTESGGVLIGCRRRGALIRVDVIDTGPGIPADQHEHIFKEFHRGTEANCDEGRGIGLTVVRHIATLLGASLELASLVDRGTRFSLWLPVEGATAQTRSEDAE